MVVDGGDSNWKPVLSGVPQGSVGPTRAYLIFNIHQWSKIRGNKQNIGVCG